jgi:pimeloyl-ACP methyl ester carboxylesterase
MIRRDGKDGAAENGSPVQQIRLSVSGLQIRCLIAGTSGPAVVLLHGAGLDAAGLSLGSAMIALADRWQVFAPDLPGFGDSDPMPAGWGFAEYSAFLGPLLDALRLPRASLAGLSMGGGIALGFVLRAPERVEKLALIDSASLDDAIPGGRLASFFVHTPGLNAIGWSVSEKQPACNAAGAIAPHAASAGLGDAEAG